MPEGAVFCCGVPFVSVDILWINTPLTPCSPALSGAIHFWKTEVRYTRGILQLLMKRSVRLHEVTLLLCTTSSLQIANLLLFYRLLSIACGLVQGTPGAFILPVIVALRVVIGFALYLLPCADS